MENEVRNIERNNDSNAISLTPEEFYSQLTASSVRFIDSEIQEKFRHSNILIAGVGSVGNPIAMMAVRSGAENLTVLDPDVVAVDNLSRQHYKVNQVGENKAVMTGRNLKEINPFVNVECIDCGLTPDNAEQLVSKSDIVVDAVDIKSLDMVYELHKWAAILGKPVLVGYDLAGTAMVAVYRYDKSPLKPLKGELTQEKIDTFNQIKEFYKQGSVTDGQFLDYVYDSFAGPIPPLRVPVEQLNELINRDPQDGRTYQLGTTATVLSALMVESMRQIVADEEIKDVIMVDIPCEVRRSNPNVLSKFPLLLRTLSVIKQRSQRVEESIQKML